MYLVLQFSEFLWPKGKCTKNFCTNRFHLESAMYIAVSRNETSFEYMYVSAHGSFFSTYCEVK